MDMALYVTKHCIIRDYLEQIRALAAHTIERVEAVSIAECINKMTGVLNMHLASEDSFVYPKLLEHNEEKIRSLTKSYMEEMRGLAAAYTDFHQKYNTPSKILADVEGFKAAFKVVRDALLLRMDREEKELYTFCS